MDLHEKRREELQRWDQGNAGVDKGVQNNDWSKRTR